MDRILKTAVTLAIKYKLALIGAVLGALSGYLYFYFVGCADGSCAITSSPVNSSLYGALMGGLLFDMFSKNKTDKKEGVGTDH